VDVSDAATGRLTLSVARAGDDEVVPFHQVFEATGPEWLTGTVAGVSHRHEGQPWTEVRLGGPHEGEPDRVLFVPEQGGDAIVHALVEVQLAGAPISLLVDDGRVERFRLP
jgi:hypothetical protein